MTKWQLELEASGYAAGLADQDMNEASLWKEAWGEPSGTNAPMYLMAGWVAGRAVRKVQKVTGVQDV